MPPKYGNKRRQGFLASIPEASIDDENDNLYERCKFNFSYFDNNNAGEDFKDWNHNELVKLLNKLRHYCAHPLSYWKNQNQGEHKVLVEYSCFPANSDFKPPKHIPKEAIWTRFHLENKARLIGFVLPEKYNNKEHDCFTFDTNTFYVVFLDKYHKFYIVNKKST